MNTEKKKSEPQDTPGTNSARIRNQSECSNASDDGAHQDKPGAASGKRQRTTSNQYMVISGLTSASPPKFVSLEEIMQAANSMQDMALVHQIVVDDNFRLTRADPPENTLEKAVKENMTKAFWDLLKTELAENPPNYRQALVLLEDVKEGLYSLLLPQHTRIRQQIEEVLDFQLIQQQTINNTLDFPHYAQYVISVMGKLCAPVRDENIKQLTEKTDVVETFKGILETLDLMKLDMANFTLQMARPEIIACSVELERKKFGDFLKIQADGLEETRKWLKSHLTDDPPPENVEYEKHIKQLFKSAFWKGCLDLIDWDQTKDQNMAFPETFMLDEERLRELSLRTERIIIVGTIILVTLSNVGADLQSLQSFKASLKDHGQILVEGMTKEKDLESILPNVAEQVITDVKAAQKAHHLSDLNDSAERSLRQQIEEIESSDHRIRQLIRQRVREFFLEIIESATAAPQKFPTGLSLLQKELTTIAGQFLRIVSHNSTVFANYYYDIVASTVPQP